MTIRLDAIPVTQLPEVIKTNTTLAPSSTRITCILHSGQLSETQHLEVSVNGVQENGVQEGSQMVFSWQFCVASDEVRITLKSGETAMKHWRGCWNERDAILHTGTLPVQVVFNGKRQPTIEPASALAALPPPAETGETKNHRDDKELALRNGAAASNAEGGPMTQVQNMLVEAQADTHPHMQEEQQATATISVPEDKGRGDEAFELEEEELEPEKEFELEDDNETGGDETLEPGEEGLEPEEVESSSPLAQEAAQATVPTGKHAAAFHASPVLPSHTLQALKDLVAKMPSKTIIVDLRQQSQKPKKYQEQSELSKEALRAFFGAKYWDRSWAIKTMLKMVPATGDQRRGTMPRQQAVVVTPDHPDGIPELVRYYQEGYSLVVIDSRANYEESARRAVIEALRQHIPDLEVSSAT